MIDATTTQPCPICNSANVRWRGRRPYDVPLTWGRWLGELLYMGSSRQALSMRRPGAGQYRDYRSNMRQEMLEARTGLTTATRFWRCPDCKNHGEVFGAKAKRSRVEDRTRPPA